MDYVLVWLSGLVTFAMAALGVWVTGHDEVAKRQRWWVYVAFSVLGAIALSVQIKQGYEAVEADKSANQSRAELSQALKDISASAKNQTTALEGMSKAQHAQELDQVRNIVLSQSNQRLAGETLQQVIGDPEHPPYLRFADFNLTGAAPNARAYLINSSVRYAARVVSLTIQMADQTYTSEAQDVSPSTSKIRARGPVTFPSTGLIDTRMVNFPDLQVGKISHFETQITTASGAYRQRTALVRISENRVLQALKVYKANDNRKYIVFFKDEGFPPTEEHRLDLGN